MSTEREDGPVKHYRLLCDKCGKQSKRGIGEPPPLPAGWQEVENDPDENCWDEYSHYCPKCSASQVVIGPKEIVPNVGNSFEISDHDAVARPLMRKDANTLIIDLQDGAKLVITSNTAVKVEQIED